MASNVEVMQKLFPKCPICKSEEGYEPSPFYPNIQCKSCKSEWALYEYGMELKTTSKTGWIKELLYKKYSFDFWKELKKPSDPQITYRIFAPMDCVGGAPEHVEPSKGYLIFKSESTMVYVGIEKGLRWPKKMEIEIPIRGIRDATVKTKKEFDLVSFLGRALAFGLVGALLFPEKKKFLVLTYEDSVGMLHHRIFDFHDDEKSVGSLINLLNYLKSNKPKN